MQVFEFCCHFKWEVEDMLSKCANPACSAPFRDLSQGKLFLVETETPSHQARAGSRRPIRHLQRYWLCDHCFPLYTLVAENKQGVTTVPLSPLQDRKTPIALRPGENGSPMSKTIVGA